MVLLLDSNKIYEVCAIYNKDLNFYNLKLECENQSNTHRIGEDNINGVYNRYYLDGDFKYTFTMSKVPDVGMNYKVWVSINRTK